MNFFIKNAVQAKCLSFSLFISGIILLHYIFFVFIQRYFSVSRPGRYFLRFFFSQPLTLKEA